MIPFQTFRSNLYPSSRESPHRSLRTRTYSPYFRNSYQSAHASTQSPIIDDNMLDISRMSPIELSSDDSDESDDAVENVASVMKSDIFNGDSMDTVNWLLDPEPSNDEPAPSTSNTLKRPHPPLPKDLRKFQRIGEAADDVNIRNPTNIRRSERTLPSNENNDNADEQIDIKPIIKTENSDAASVESEQDNNSNVTVKSEHDIKIEPSNQTEDNDSASENNDTKAVIHPTEIKKEYVAFLLHFLSLQKCPIYNFSLVNDEFESFDREHIKEEVHTLDDSDVKEEPVSSTSDNEQTESATISNTDVPMQQQTPITTSDDYENDPEAGPSGLNTQASDRFHGARSLFHRYPHDSSDTESDDDREIVTSLWRSREAFGAKEKNRDLPWRLRQSPATAFPEPANDTSMTEVVDLSQNDSSGSIRDVNPSSPQRSSGIEILTAPDLQLDWVSDATTESEDDLICTTDLPTRNQNEPLNFTTPFDPEPALNSHSMDAMPIDLTVSDEEDNPNETTNNNSDVLDIQPVPPRNQYQSLADEHHTAPLLGPRYVPCCGGRCTNASRDRYAT